MESVAFGVAWVVRDAESVRSVQRLHPEGELSPPPLIEAHCLALSERTGTVWLATRDKYIAMTPRAVVLSEQPREPRGWVHEMIAR